MWWFRNALLKKCCCYRMELGFAHLCTVKPIYEHQVVVKKVQMWRGCQTRSWDQLMCKNFKLTDKLQGSILKGKMRERNCRRYDQLLHNSLIDWWWGNRVLSEGLTLSVLRLPLDWGLHAHGHHIFNFSHLVGAVISIKQLRNVHQIQFLYTSGRN